MKKIGLLSDTHGCLPPALYNHFKSVDEIWHAGDIGNMETLQKLQAFKPLRAVFGNIDGQDIRIQYPEINFFTIENVSVLMMHIGGYPPKYNAYSMQQIRHYNPHLFVCGHSHILKIIPDTQHNLLHLNPGACGNQGWHKTKTLLRFSINHYKVENMEVIELK